MLKIFLFEELTIGSSNNASWNNHKTTSALHNFRISILDRLYRQKRSFFTWSLWRPLLQSSCCFSCWKHTYNLNIYTGQHERGTFQIGKISASEVRYHEIEKILNLKLWPYFNAHQNCQPKKIENSKLTFQNMLVVEKLSHQQ